MTDRRRLRLNLARAILAIALAGALLVAFCTKRLHGQSADSLPPCDGAALGCMTLVATPDLHDAAGVLILAPQPTPFGIAVTPDGRPRRLQIAHITGLPDPRTLGDFATYVAWSASLSLDSVVKLGEVRDGRVELGETTREQFRILVSAERSPDVSARAGRLVLRGTSPGSRLLAHRDLMGMWRASSGTANGSPRIRQSERGTVHATGRDRARSALTMNEHEHGATPPASSSASWSMPPTDPRLASMPGAHALEPHTPPYWPAARGVLASLPRARRSVRLRLRSGDTLRLVAAPVQRTLEGKTFAMLAFNRQLPGPLLDVDQEASIVVRFVNRLDQPSAVHWHGVRLDQASDGVPGLTQPPVAAGDSFTYHVRFPDAGLFWYHPHVREDLQQDLGLAGSILVHPRRDELEAVNRDAMLMLDDLLVDDRGPAPHGADAPTHALMGRFGNVLLVNGEPRWTLDVRRGDVVRLWLTNASSARVFNLSLPGARMKVVASDGGAFAREAWVGSVAIAPAERYVVDVRFDTPGSVPLVHAIQRLDHMLGTLTPQADTLGVVTVGDGRATPDLSPGFSQLHDHAAAGRELGPLHAALDREPDHTLLLTMRTHDLPPTTNAMMTGGALPVEWNDGMPMMNWTTTSHEVEWILRDAATGKENMDAEWRVPRGTQLRVRVVNDPAAPHGMDHPIHLHGQRFLVLARDGVPAHDLVWKDTALVPAGETVELLIDASNPGRWMLHCHIAEHLGSGMMMSLVVE